MSLKEDLELFWKDFKLWVVFFGSLATTALLLWGLYDPVDKRFDTWVHAHARLDQGKLAVDDRLHVVLTLAVLALVFVFVGVSFTSVMLVHVRKAAAQTAKTRNVLKYTFDGTLEAAALISKQLFPQMSQPVKRVIYSKQIYTLFDNGDCHCTDDLVVEAGTYDLHFMTRSVEAQPKADPAPFPADIKLSMQSRTAGSEVRYLLTRNTDREKQFTVFFLPVIKAGTTDRREIRMEYYWKGMMKQLLADRFEDCDLSFESADDIPELEFEFWAKPGIGVIDCEIISQRLAPGTEHLEKVSDPKGLKGWRYRAKPVPKGHTPQLKLKLETS